jgi:hypothetical protein
MKIIILIFVVLLTGKLLVEGDGEYHSDEEDPGCYYLFTDTGTRFLSFSSFFS